MKPDKDPFTVKLTEYAKSAGCAAKIGQSVLSKIISSLPPNNDPALLIGTETSDDAAVYKLSDDTAIVQTIDFFPPVVDNPYTFGQIAAANALSDIYAMGAEPLTALNVVAFPSCLGAAVISEILRGGADKVHEAGASIVGGHSINIEEPLYGLSVTGIVNPYKIRRNFGAVPGDVLILTKPIGTGIINTAVKAKMSGEKEAEEAVRTMCTLNRAAKRVFDGFNIDACTDITGFSLAGHCREMAVASNVTLHIDFAHIPLVKGASEYAEQGLVPQGTYHNRDFAGTDVFFDTNDDSVSDIIFDPQTSGGLLVSVSESIANDVISALSNYNGGRGIGTQFAIIGHVADFDGTYIRIHNSH